MPRQTVAQGLPGGRSHHPPTEQCTRRAEHLLQELGRSSRAAAVQAACEAQQVGDPGGVSALIFRHWHS